MNALRRIFLPTTEEIADDIEMIRKLREEQLNEPQPKLISKEGSVLLTSSPFKPFARDCEKCVHYWSRNVGFVEGGYCSKHNNIDCGWGFTCEDWEGRICFRIRRDEMSNTIVAVCTIVFFLAVLGAGVFFVKEGICNRDFYIIPFGIAFILLALSPLGLVWIDHQKNIANSDISITEVEVMDKTYRPAFQQVIIIGGVPYVIPHSGASNVVISDGDTSQTINSSELYAAVEVGSRFEVRKIVYTNKKGKIVSQEFVLLDWSDRED